MNEETLAMPELRTETPIEECCIKQYQPSRMECLKNYQINIEFLSIGCIVRVGCMTIPFTSITDAMDAIEEYIENPYEERQRWEKFIKEKNN